MSVYPSGTRWRHRSGVFTPLDEGTARLSDDGALTLSETALLAWFRCLARELQVTVAFHVRNLALYTGEAS